MKLSLSKVTITLLVVGLVCSQDINWTEFSTTR
jgi:Papain family cysteine protease